MKKGNKLALACPPYWKFERIDHNNGDFSWEINHDGKLIALYECNFDKRGECRKTKDFIEYHSPEFMVNLYASYHEMKSTLEALKGLDGQVGVLIRTTLEGIE